MQQLLAKDDTTTRAHRPVIADSAGGSPVCISSMEPECSRRCSQDRTGQFVDRLHDVLSDRCKRLERNRAQERLRRKGKWNNYGDRLISLLGDNSYRAVLLCFYGGCLR